MVAFRVDDVFPARTASEAQTIELGRTLAGRLEPGAVVALYGELGAGKTALARGIAEGLAVNPSHVHSPTFTILIEHASGRIPLYHFDAYRIERVEEFFDLGYEEYFYGDGICVIEWADRIESILPDDAVRIRLEHDTVAERRIDLVSA